MCVNIQSPDAINAKTNPKGSRWNLISKPSITVKRAGSSVELLPL